MAAVGGAGGGGSGGGSNNITGTSGYDYARINQDFDNRVQSMISNETDEVKSKVTGALAAMKESMPEKSWNSHLVSIITGSDQAPFSDLLRSVLVKMDDFSVINDILLQVNAQYMENPIDPLTMGPLRPIDVSGLEGVEYNRDVKLVPGDIIWSERFGQTFRVTRVGRSGNQVYVDRISMENGKITFNGSISMIRPSNITSVYRNSSNTSAATRKYQRLTRRNRRNRRVSRRRRT